MAPTILTRRAGLALLPGMLLATAAHAQRPQAQGQGWEQPSGTITIEQTQVGLIIGASWGGGILRFGGQNYRFKLKGLGIGELGAAKITASGDVYGLKRVQDFPGAYGQMQASATGGRQNLGTELWLHNRAGVRLNLRAQRQGWQLTLGADGLIIELA